MPSAFTQNEYLIENTNDTILSLGSATNKDDFYIKKNELKTFYKNEVEYRDLDDLVLVNVMSSKEFLERIKLENLMFVFEGTEPFWKAEINANEICFTLFDNSSFDADIQFRYNEINNTFNIGFSSKEITVYGVISKVECDCLYEIEDRLEHAEYKLNLVINNLVYSSCGSLERNVL